MANKATVDTMKIIMWICSLNVTKMSIICMIIKLVILPNDQNF
jgi:hypothetical protein